MLKLAHSHKGKRSHDLKQKVEKKEKFNVIIQDFVIDYNHSEHGTVKPKSAQKRKLLSGDWDWDWAPYAPKFKTPRDDAFESDYLSDGLDDSQIVPSCAGNEPNSKDLMFCEGGDSSHSNSADIHILTIGEFIEFDNSKSPTGHDFEEEPISFDMEELCEIVSTEQGNGEDLTIHKETALNMLLAFTSNSRLPVEPPGDLYVSSESSQTEVTNEVYNDCQIEEFKFARCFKCRRKVYVLQDCPRHLTKRAMAKNK